MEKISRRDFLKQASLVSAGLMVGTMGLNAKSYSRVIGANDRVHLGFIGVNGRGHSQAQVFAKLKNVDVDYICDVDSTVIDKTINAVEKISGTAPKGVTDFRTILSDKNLDALVHSTPDHWHSPGAIICAQAGKHSYVEKPLSHSPREGELVIEAMKKYNVLIQMGSQRRSFPLLQEAMAKLRNGEIGKIHMAKGWYANNRGPLTLKPATAPATLDYELWQGPAVRKPYMDGLIHYNWHWLWNWGTGEALNNGTHEIDLIRWGLGIEFPSKVTSIGGRYTFDDAWETPDTQIISWEAPGVTIFWEGRSCSGANVENDSRGVIFYGDKAYMVTGNNDYKIYDNKNKLIESKSSGTMAVEGQNTTSVSLDMDSLHAANFVDAIRGTAKSTCTAETGHASTVWVQLGNIAQRVGRNLTIDPKNGHIIGDKEAQKLWTRDYAPGWEPKV